MTKITEVKRYLKDQGYKVTEKLVDSYFMAMTELDIKGNPFTKYDVLNTMKESV